MIPRGIRNNNPGNIRHGEPWQGLADEQPDPNFATFVNAFWGIRALCKTLLSYQRKHNRKTVKEMLFRWAPPVENDTDAYVEAVAADVGVRPNDPVDLSDVCVLAEMAKAIIKHENGIVPYADEDILAAAKAALGIA